MCSASLLLLRRHPRAETPSRSLEHGVDAAVALQLVLDAHRIGQRAERLLLDLLWNSASIALAATDELLLADGGLQLLDGRDDLLDRGVRGFERADDLRFGDFLGARLDHHDAVAAAGDDQVERALLALGVGRVDDVLAVDQADAHAGDRSSRTGSPRAPAPPRRR